MVQLRNIVRESARAQSQIPTFAYEILDQTSGRKSADPSYLKKLEAGKFEEVIKSSTKSNSKYTSAFKITAKAGKILKVGSTFIIAVDISNSAARVYLANEKEQQQKALENLGEDIGTTAGVYAGAKICVALTVATAGTALIGCGIALGVGALIGGEFGSMVIGGQAANNLVGKLKHCLLYTSDAADE